MTKPNVCRGGQQIAKMATVVLDIAFWAYAAFRILFIPALSNLDRFQCRRRISYFF